MLTVYLDVIIGVLYAFGELRFSICWIYLYLCLHFYVNSIDLNAGYSLDDGLPKRMGQGDMSVFRDAVQDCLDYDTESAKKFLKSKQDKRSNDAEVEKFSGLRIRYVQLQFSRKILA